MKYLELNELVFNKWYECILYDGTKVVVEYIADELFEDEDFIYDMSDIRYVLGEFHEI